MSWVLEEGYSALMWEQEAVYYKLGKRKMFCVPGMGETWEEEARK